MAYFDETQSKFLDNLIKGASNEELFQLAQSAREPASAQKEKIVRIEAQPIQPIELGYNTPKNPTTKIMVDNANRAINQRMADQKGFAEIGTKAAEDLEKNKNSLLGIQQRIQDLEGKKYVPDRNLQDQITEASQNLDKEKYPDRDMLSELILSLGPAVLGGLSGETGAIAQQKVAKESRDLYENLRKEGISTAKSKNEAALKKFQDLLKLKQSQGEMFSKEQQLELERLKAQLQGGSTIATLSDKQIQRADDKMNEIGKENASTIKDVSIKAAESEYKPTEEENKNKRAALSASASMQRAQQPTGAELKAAGQLGMVRKANADLEAIGGADGMQFPSLRDPSFTYKAQVLSGKAAGSSLTENLIKDPKVRSQIQAETDWATTTLRDESGAAIGKEEAVNQLHRYFPRYGDGPEQVAQKAAARKQREAALEVEAGRAKAPDVVPTKRKAPPVTEMSREQKIEAIKALRAKKAGN